MHNVQLLLQENAVLEWKFARTQVWISYFGKHPMIPPPFNVFPTFTDIKWALGAIKEAVKISTSTIPQVKQTRWNPGLHDQLKTKHH